MYNYKFVLGKTLNCIHLISMCGFWAFVDGKWGVKKKVVGFLLVAWFGMMGVGIHLVGAAAISCKWSL